MKNTLETYIKMCERAREIQSQFPFEADEDALPNMFYCPDEMCLSPAWTPTEVFSHEAIWLPHQAQLQEMLGGFNLVQFWQVFFSYSDEGTGYELPQWAEHCESWEQLWLAFVMKEKYDKIWDGENWNET